jgi:DNA-binding transcriptional MerR regulator
MAVGPKRTSRKESGKIYYSISEVADLTDVRPHVLRYWESKFKMLKPKKNRAGNRMYRAKDIDLVLRIKDLLYDRRFTIAGARRRLLDERRTADDQIELDFDRRIAERTVVMSVKKELEEILEILSKGVGGER